VNDVEDNLGADISVPRGQGEVAVQPVPLRGLVQRVEPVEVEKRPQSRPFEPTASTEEAVDRNAGVQLPEECDARPADQRRLMESKDD
jgi:hypothetical protein